MRVTELPAPLLVTPKTLKTLPMAAAIWAVGRWLLLLLLVSNQYGAYGILGALMGVMFWYYFASSVVVLGAEFVRALSEEGAGD